jgi:hypothetical protein
MESGGRTPEERRAAAQARARARRGQPRATGDEEDLGEAGPGGADDAGARAGESRHMGVRRYGGLDVYLRRRLVAGAVVIVLIIAIFLLVGGC